MEGNEEREDIFFTKKEWLKIIMWGVIIAAFLLALGVVAVKVLQGKSQ